MLRFHFETISNIHLPSAVHNLLPEFFGLFKILPEFRFAKLDNDGIQYSRKLLLRNSKIRQFGFIHITLLEHRSRFKNFVKSEFALGFL